MDIKKLKEDKFEIDERENYIIQNLECCLNCSYHETYAGLRCRLFRFHRFGEAYLPHEVNPLGKCDKYFDERKY